MLSEEPTFPVADLTALAALVSAGMPAGSTAHVLTVDDYYTLDKTAADTPDGVAVIAATGGGNWVAQTYGRWEDLRIAPQTGNKKAELTNEAYRDTGLNMLHFRHDQDNELHFAYQMPHHWDGTTQVHPHLHLIPCADPVADRVAYFMGYYVWVPVGSAAPAISGWTALTPISFPIRTGGVDVYKHFYFELGEISPPASPGNSCGFLLRIWRAGTDGADTYNTSKSYGTTQANLAVVFSDLHYRRKDMGSVTEL